MIDRYSITEINEIFSDKNKFNKWLLIEKKLLKFLLSKNYFSSGEYEKLVASLSVNPLEVFFEEKTTKHDMVAFLNVISSKASVVSKKWIHYGLTSSDIVDTGNSLLLKEVNEFLIKKLNSLQITLRKLAFKYKNLAQIGRTHGMHAEITSFGYKFAIYYSDLRKAIRDFYLIRREVECVMVSGSVGTYANTSLELQDFLALELDLYNSYGSTQVLSRERYACYFSNLNIIGQIIHKIAYELRHLHRTEVAEVNEKFEEGQIGSSSMPHKKNPVVLENICGLSRLLKGYSVSSLDNISLWHERDISHSSVERVLFLDATSVLATIVTKLDNCLKSLEVNEEKISKNILLTNGNIFSQTAFLTLIPKVNISRTKLHQEIQNISQKSYDNNTSFKEELKKSVLFKELSEKEFNDIFSIEYHLRNIDKVYDRVFSSEKYFSHFDEILWRKEEILNAIYKLSNKLNREYENSKEEIVLISLMKGVMVFVGHLLVHLTFKCTLKNVYLSFYGDKKSLSVSENEKKLEDLDLEICREKKVLILDDLIDTGYTVSTLKKILEKFKPKSVKVCALFKKDNGNNKSMVVDWWGLSLPNMWVAGFGMDSCGKYRNMDFVGVLKDQYKN